MSRADLELGTRSATVVICSRDRKPLLLEALARVASQQCSTPWDVLVIDNDSSDGTCGAVKALAADFPVPLRCVREPLRGLSHARNRALMEATGDVLVWTDDDTLPRSGWLEAHVRAYAPGDVLCISGRVIVRLPDEVHSTWRQALAGDIGGPTARYEFGDQSYEVRRGNMPFPFGANMSFDRRLGLEVGGFRADLGWGDGMVPSEESEFFRRLNRMPGRVVYEPAAAVVHQIEPARLTLAYFERWHRGRGRAIVRFEEPKRLEELVKRLAGKSQRALRYRVAERRARSLTARLAALKVRAQAEGAALELATRINRFRAGR